MRKCEEYSDVCTQEEPCDWLMIDESLKVEHVWSMQGSWRVTTARVLQHKTSSLAKQLACDSNSQLVPVARSSSQNALFDENWHFAFLIHPTINTLIPKKCRLTYPQSSSFNSPNSSPLTVSIDISLRGTFSQILSHHTHIREEVFWCLGSSLEETNLF